MQQADDSRRHQSSTRKRREPTRTRKRDWGAFIEALSKSGHVTLACRVTGIPKRTAYDRRKADPEFARRWEEAVEVAVSILEDEARRRAVEGTARLRFDGRGRLIQVERTYSDALLLLLLRAYFPKKYGRQAGQDGPRRGAVHWHFGAGESDSQKGKQGDSPDDAGC